MSQEPKGLKEASVPDRVDRSGLDVLRRKRIRWSQREPGGVQQGALLKSSATNTQEEKTTFCLSRDGTLKNKHLRVRTERELKNYFKYKLILKIYMEYLLHAKCLIQLG